jgi:thioredoxin 1
MHKSDAPAASAAAGNFIDQPVTGITASPEGSVQVGHPVADVMNAGAPPGEEPGDRTIRLERGEKLHLGIAERQRHDRGTVSRLRCLGFESEHVAVEGEGRIEVGHGNADMRDAGAIRHAVPPTNLGRAGINYMENNIMAAPNAPSVHVTDASFASEIEQANGLVLVDFWATWCGPCLIVAPILEQLAGEYAGRAKVAKVDVDANQRTAMRFNVRSIPSILFFKNGQHVDTVIGAVPKATLEGKIKQHLA